MTGSPNRTYAGSTLQQRQARRREALIEAALELIGENGMESISAIAVCKRARLNQRYFSESFGNREELLLAMIDDTAAEALKFGLAASGGFAALDSSRAVEIMSALIDFVTSNPGRRALMIEMQATPALRGRREDFVGMIARIVETKAAEALGDRVVTGTDLRIAALVITNGALDTVTMWLTGTLDITRDDLIGALANLMTTVTQAGGVLTTPSDSVH
ncbi:TetR/AcrR family transcriptional regulator [Antrihabitans stalactiti]|uniref:TetR/AcrR family transcriptional regulator n=1 Tax=Antrihabitans stalactiti TaxID=2584121 RepID=A0A848KQN2_9NOCA|nr:TetR/AcrR family transcriptional regulator [Antrihabitans stalactiti]NMN98902.1 TetR/AcrR family transcriptional regulator [Antrihabitans stalactiti]